MCGVCGVVSTAGPVREEDVALVRRMLGRLRHRGPDGSGTVRDERAVLGHTRLAVIDPEGGAQPLSGENGDVWVACNGEIFNYVELRGELRALGHTFRTAGDTEVVAHAWEEWGEECFARFNGQWGLALWDRRTGRLVLCRDRLGVRPLFWTRLGDRFLFASEVKALFADRSVDRSLDPDGLAETLTYWCPVAPRTVFRAVVQLQPGHLAVLDADGTLRVAPYWVNRFPRRGAEPSQDLRANTEALRERLVEACRLRFLRSDVPVGAYLSGGIDSSVTAAVVARLTDAPLETFSLRFADDEFDEGAYQRQMVRRLGTRHQDVVVTRSAIAEVFPEVVRHTETPVLRAAPAPLLLLSRLVHDQGYRVVVTGEGADEVLAGYDLFREARVRLFLSRNPDSAVRGRALELLYPWMVRSPGLAPAFARSFFGRHLDPDDPALSHRPRWDATTAVQALLAPDVRAAGRVGDVVASMPPDNDEWDPLGRAQWLEMTTLLAGYILSSQGDRMLMASSVEGRFPFLDRDVVELANALPARHKLFGLEEKFLLKQAFADLVPPEILHRPKQPYRAPDAASFLAADRPAWVDEVTSRRAVRDAGILDADRVAGLLDKGRRTGGTGLGNTDNMRVLAVLSTQLVHALFVRDGGGPDGPPAPPHVEIDLRRVKVS